ncbi:hypothetical protein CVT26_009773 [Gymnopilus dilepis]|uniref:DUF6534 domain-containing protein n=1 Tax=Gymnopilus dilepis TaxID=231916 RepID=A0A409YIQ1_9AGAR|nr:hypothetical protein CVT26_009773 [Gymnopilus dilepis]
MVFTVQSLQLQTWTELKQLRGLSMAVNVIGALADVIIAIALFVLLYKSQTAHQTLWILSGPDYPPLQIILSISTGMLTSLCAVASLISILVLGNTLIYVAFYFSLGRLYSNSLLASLNVRHVVRRSGEISSAFSLPLQSISQYDERNPSPPVRFTTHHASTIGAESLHEEK